MTGYAPLKNKLILLSTLKIVIVIHKSQEITMTKSWNDLADLQEPDYSTYNNLLIIDANNLSYQVASKT